MKQDNNVDVLNKIWFFLLPEIFEMVEWGRESKTAEMYTEGKMQIYSGPYFLRSGFGRLVQGHLKIESS